MQLRYANSTGSEGNWLPFEHAGRLYVSYTLCPHRVLAVDALLLCLRAAGRISTF